MKWIMVYNIIDSAGDPVDDAIILRVSDDNFNDEESFDTLGSKGLKERD